MYPRLNLYPRSGQNNESIGRVSHVVAFYFLQQVKWSHSSSRSFQQQIFFSLLRTVLLKIQNQVSCALFPTCCVVVTGVITAEAVLGVSQELRGALYQVLWDNVNELTVCLLCIPLIGS